MKTLLSTFLLLSAVLIGAAEKPLARVGLMSDTHVTRKPASCRILKKAMQLFKTHKVDMIINCGDVADKYWEQAYKNYRNTVKSVYPQNKPKELFAFAWHDVINVGNWHTGWEKAWPLFKKGLEIEHEPYSKHYLAGFIFLTAPQNTDWQIYEKMIADACKETPGKPVFLVDHVPAGNTVYNSGTWGSIRARKVLNRYPQIVQISGHVHGTFRNELQIWQGEFTQINVGSTGSPWGGSLVGTAPTGSRSDEALIMELFKDKFVVRRFDLQNNTEYKKEAPWTFPIPFDPKTAPYTAGNRRMVIPEFAKNSTVAIKPDKVPCSSITATFPEAKCPEGTFIYEFTLFRKNTAGKWESFSTRESFGGFRLPENKRTFNSHTFSAGFFDSGKEYRIRITPRNFLGQNGKPLYCTFTMPAKADTVLVYESTDPMKDCPFTNGLSGGKRQTAVNGFYKHNFHDARLEFPQNVWQGPAGTRFRFTIDMHMKQPGKERQWTLVLRNPKPLQNANARIATPQGDSGVQRYVIEISKQEDLFNYYLLVREGLPGEIRFNYVKIEKLK